MTSTALLPPDQVAPADRSTSSFVDHYFSLLLERLGNKRIDLRSAATGVALLILIAAVRMYWTWATWGDLSVDAGHETYVPAVLAEGKMLYRDVWYHYGPAAPYLNSYLFRLFGVHLEVLYFAGAFAAVGSAIFLFLSGIELRFPLAGWTAGAILVLEGFEPGLMSFPLPYSFASVYGCLVACTLLWILIRAVHSKRWGWTAVAGTLACCGLLLKLEYGMASYLAVGVVVGIRALQKRDWKAALKDGAGILPGLILGMAVIRWMILIRGVDFITQENIMSWPTSYFMKTYGAAWLAFTGLTLTWGAFGDAAVRTVFVLGVIFVVRRATEDRKPSRRQSLEIVVLVLGLAAYFSLFLQKTSLLGSIEAAFFPHPMPLYVAIGALGGCWYLWRRGWQTRLAALVVALGLAAVLAFRVLLLTIPIGYPIYYSGPTILGYLILVGVLVECRKGGNRWVGKGTNFLCFACLFAVMLRVTVMGLYLPPQVPLQTAHGTPRVSEGVARNYEAGIAFLKSKDQLGESVLILPEDTTMYFLAGVHTPTRVYSFTPGVLAPGRMTEELLREIEGKHVKYLLWSNRIFPEYGVPMFGRDFNQDLYAYLTSNYRLVGPLVPGSYEKWGLNFNVWEKKASGFKH